MAARLRVGLIGSGLIAQAMHLHYLRELRDRFEIAGLCDLSPTLLEQVGSFYNVPPERRVQRWQDLVQMPLDVVMILTSGSHAPAAIAAAQLGRHVFVEKPMCFSPAEGRTMIEAARKAGVTLMVGYMKRYDPAFERLQQELETFDDLRLIQVTTLESPIPNFVGHLPLVKANDVDQEVLKGLQAESEALIDQAVPGVSAIGRWAYRWILLDSLVHELGVLRGALGAPEGVEFADLSEQNVTLQLRYRGVRCVLTWVDLPQIGRYQEDFAFYSPMRRLVLSFPSPFLRSMPTKLILEGGEPFPSPRSWHTEEIVSYDEAFRRELLELYDCISNGRPPRTPGEEGLADVELCQAVVARFEERVGRAAS